MKNYSHLKNTSTRDLIVAIRAFLSRFVEIREYLKALVDPPHLDKTLNRVRNTTIIESGTVTTVGTVTTATVSELTNINSQQGRLLILGADLSAWAACCRSRIS